MGKVKVAVVGCGTIGTSEHIPAYMKNDEAEIKYFCDIIPERAQAMVDKYHCGTAVKDYHDILKDPEVVAVSVCTPNDMHAKIAIDFLQAGKNVLSEKPAARTYEEALEMQKVAHETGKILNIGVCNRFNASVDRIRSLIARGDLGGVYHVYVSFRCNRSIPGLGGPFTTKAIAGGGVLIDWGVHFLDLTLYCIGEPKAVTVTGQAYSKLGSPIKDYTYINGMWAHPPIPDGTFDVEDFVTGMIRTTGPTITFNGAWAQNIGKNEMFIDFIGDKAGVRLQYGESFVLYTAKDGALVEETPSFDINSHFQNEINAYVKCVQTGEKIRSYIDRVIETSQIMQAIYDSSEKKAEITL